MATTTKKATKTDLRKPQVRILTALSKAKDGLSRKEIAEKAKVDSAWLTSWVGSLDDSVRAKNDKKVFPSLVSLGFIKPSIYDIDGKDVAVYSITAGGKKALTAATKK